MNRGVRVRLKGKVLTFAAGREVTLGRDPKTDVHTDNPLVSRWHAVLRPHADGWLLVDTESSRGTYVDAHKITRVLLSAPTTVWLAEPGEGQKLLLLPDMPEVAESTGIFLSYRRRGTAGYSGRLFDRLRAKFGDDQIFRDVDDVGPGTQYVDRIRRAVGSCKVLIAVIGPGWVDALDNEGRRRLDDPTDLVRVEIEAGLERPHVRVIPVLVGGASMPSPATLPGPLAELAYRQAQELHDARWDYDVSRLIDAIEDALGAPESSRELVDVDGANDVVDVDDGRDRTDRGVADAPIEIDRPAERDAADPSDQPAADVLPPAPSPLRSRMVIVTLITLAVVTVLLILVSR